MHGVADLSYKNRPEMSLLVSHWVCQYSRQAAESDQKSVLLVLKKCGLSSSTRHHLRSIWQHVDDPPQHSFCSVSLLKHISMCTCFTDSPCPMCFFCCDLTLRHFWLILCGLSYLRFFYGAYVRLQVVF